ncbi:MAG: acetylornithine transaminase [Deltaproteobacteria bacterium]|nr:acetylornithine transaminase [Deltaproteobacteria bacterium]
MSESVHGTSTSTPSLKAEPKKTADQLWAERAKQVFTPNYAPAELVIDRGEGCYVWDLEGRRYLDLVAGIAVSALGHHHPKLVAAIQAQAEKVLHTSNLYLNQPSIELAERLVRHSFGQRVFFCNSGAEANEAAIKLARRYAYTRGETERVKIYSFDKSFHGRTMGALTATAQPKYHEGFRPLPEGFGYLTMDLAAVEAAIDHHTAAVIIEPVQGEGGVRVPPPGFLAALRKICTAKGALLIFDEVQIGLGRSGAMFGYQLEGVAPDIMSLAKGLGGGLPIGAIVTTDAIAPALNVGSHGTTFGGNPMACAAGLAVFDVLESPGFLERVRATGLAFEAGLRAIAQTHGGVSEVRGRGLLLGMALTKDAGFEAKDVVKACRDLGVLVHVAGPDVVRLLPPLILGPAELAEGLSAIDRAFAGLRGRA